MLGQNDQQGVFELKSDDDGKDRAKNRLEDRLVDRIDSDIDNQMPYRADQMNRRYGGYQHDERNQGQNDRLFKTLVECQAPEQLDEAGPVPALPGTFHGEVFHSHFPIYELRYSSHVGLVFLLVMENVLMQDTLRIMGAHRPFEPPPLPSREKEQRRRPTPDEEEPPIDPDKEGLAELLAPRMRTCVRNESVCGKAPRLLGNLFRLLRLSYGV